MIFLKKSLKPNVGFAMTCPFFGVVVVGVSATGQFRFGGPYDFDNGGDGAGWDHHDRKRFW